MDCSFAIKEHLDERWSEWFDGLTITHLETGEIVLAGRLADQAALHGVRPTLCTLGLAIVVLRSEAG